MAPKKTVCEKNAFDKNAVAKTDNTDTDISTTVSCESKLDILLNAVTAINVNISDIKTSIGAIEDKINVLSSSLDDVRRECNLNANNLQKLDYRLEQLEQYSRRYNLRLFGMQETNGERPDVVVVEWLKSHLKISVELKDIDRAHRVGPKMQNGKQRPIIIKFMSYGVRNKVYQVKKLLKGTPFVLKEDLTKARADIMVKMVNKFGQSKVWTRDGKICWMHGATIHSTNNLQEAEKLLK